MRDMITARSDVHFASRASGDPLKIFLMPASLMMDNEDLTVGYDPARLEACKSTTADLASTRTPFWRSDTGMMLGLR